MTRQLFIQYVKANQGRLRRYLVALCCGDSQTADDIAQETYMKAYLAADTFKDESKFTAWIFRIAYNTFISLCRSSKPTDDIENARGLMAEDRKDYQELYIALDRLSEKERSAILLYYIQGYAVKEIAEVMNSTENAVKVQLSRGRSHLRDLLNRIN